MRNDDQLQKAENQANLDFVNGTNQEAAFPINVHTWNLLAEIVFCSPHNRFNERLCQAPRHEHHVKTAPSTCHTANKSLLPQGPAELRIGYLKNIKVRKQKPNLQIKHGRITTSVTPYKFARRWLTKGPLAKQGIPAAADVRETHDNPRMTSDWYELLGAHSSISKAGSSVLETLISCQSAG